MSQEKILDLFGRLWKFPRSITGNGLRESLTVLQDEIPMQIVEYPTGMKCFDWEIPEEWNIAKAYIKDTKGNILLDFEDSNLHVLNYSIPINKRVSKAELFEHLYTIPELPNAIPYRTSYYAKRWGFCIQHSRLQNFKDDFYDVCIDSHFSNGSLSVGELVLNGESEKEFLLSTYMCHPSMANNELSGPIAIVLITKYLASLKYRRFTYRVVIAPETIGSIAYLSQNYVKLKNNVFAGLVVSQVGIDYPLIFKKTRYGFSDIDKTVQNIFNNYNIESKIVDFSPNGGGDQRQYSSIGIDLPIGYFGRSLGGGYPEYHTSLDNMSIISVNRMLESINAILGIIDAIETNHTYINNMPYCEPNLGKRGLYPTLGGTKSDEIVEAYKYILGYSDGSKSLLDISDLSGIKINLLNTCAQNLIKANLIKRV